MISITELILFFSFLVALGFLIGFQEKAARKKKRADHSTAQGFEDSSIRYSSAIYWFRDYWSNRLKLKRNIQKPEGFGIDTGTSSAEELPLEDSGDGRYSVYLPCARGVCVHGFGQRFADLANPYELIHQYSPNMIEVRTLGGRSMFQLPGEFFGKYREGDSVDAKMSRLNPPIEPDEVYAEPMVQAKGENWTPMLYAMIAVAIIWLESIVFRFFAPFFPWLESNQLLIIAMTLGVYLAILARFIIQEATTPIKEAFATIYLYDGGQPRELHYRFNGDVIRWLESKPYWVFRYVFRWRGELTLKKKGLLPIIHFPEDWERVEVWLDARTGAVEWIVSDYHWRELWYKAEPNLRSIHLWIYPNFHTLLPLNIETQGKGVLKDLYVEAHPLWHAFKSHLEKHAALHPDSWIARQMESRSSIVTGRLSKLWWDKWRYPLGANSNSYKNNEQPPTVGEQPSLPYARA